MLQQHKANRKGFAGKFKDWNGVYMESNNS